jgi:glycosyltransferase involved in cell wall biosynthesis
MVKKITNQITNRKLKIAYITRTHFGAMGAAASYMFPIMTNEVHRVLVLEFSPKNEKNVEPIANSNCNISVINRYNEKELNIKKNTIEVLNRFKPDIVHFFHSNRCFKDILYLRYIKSMPKVILDFRSPIYARKFSRTYIKLIFNYFCCHILSDHIITHSALTLKGNLPLRLKKYSVITPGINLKYYNSINNKIDKPRKFVYIGSLDKNRNVIKLAIYFIKAAEKLKLDIKLDIYGHGDGEEEIKILIKRKSEHKRICLKGFIPQDKLSQIISNYDVGIAYINVNSKNSIFNTAPSLKALEFAAAGIQILATESIGHLEYVKHYGFKFIFFRNTFSDFFLSLKTIIDNGIDTSDIKQNKKSVQNFDWKKNVRNNLLPIYKNLVEKKK